MLEPHALRQTPAQGGLEAGAGQGLPAGGLIGEREERRQAGEAEVREQPVVVARVVGLRGEHLAVLVERVEQRQLVAIGQQVLACGRPQDVGEIRGPVTDHLVRPGLRRRGGAAVRVVVDPVDGDLGGLAEVGAVARGRIARQQWSDEAELLQVLAVALGVQRIGVPVDRRRQLGRLRSEDVEAALAGGRDPRGAHGRQRDARVRGAGRGGQRRGAAQREPPGVRTRASGADRRDGEQRRGERDREQHLDDAPAPLGDHQALGHDPTLALAAVVTSIADP